MRISVIMFFLLAVSLWVTLLHPMRTETIDLLPKIPFINKPDGLTKGRVPYFWHYGTIGCDATSDKISWFIDAEKTRSKFPATLQNQLTNQSVKKIYFIVNIHFFSKNTEPKPLSINTAFHDFVRFIYKQSSGNWLSGFDIQMPIGLFSGDGVAQDDIAFDSFSNLPVHYHDECYSPNNARFFIQGNRKITTCWIVGIEPSLKYALVSYNLFMYDKEHKREKLISKDYFHSEHPNKILKNLLEYANNQASNNPDLNGTTENQTSLYYDNSDLNRHYSAIEAEQKLTFEWQEILKKQKAMLEWQKSLEGTSNQIIAENNRWPQKLEILRKKTKLVCPWVGSNQYYEDEEDLDREYTDKLQVLKGWQLTQSKIDEIQANIQKKLAFTPFDLSLTNREDQEALRNFVATIETMRQPLTIADTTEALEWLQTKLTELTNQLRILKNRLENLKTQVNSMIPPIFNAIKT